MLKALLTQQALDKSSDLNQIIQRRSAADTLTPPHPFPIRNLQTVMSSRCVCVGIPWEMHNLRCNIRHNFHLLSCPWFDILKWIFRISEHKNSRVILVLKITRLCSISYIISSLSISNALSITLLLQTIFQYYPLPFPN